MREILENILSGPGKYIGIICVIYLVIGLPLTLIYMKKMKNKTKKYIEENPDASKIITLTSTFLGDFSDNLDIAKVDGKKPNVFYEKMKRGILILPGKHILEVEASWTRKKVFKTVHTSTGYKKIEIEVEAKKNYSLKYNTEEKRFIFEEDGKI